MNKLSFLALCWLIFVGAFIGGLVVYDTKSWPYGPYIAVKEFVLGDPSEDLSLREKIINDLNLQPTRHIKSGGADKNHLSNSTELGGLPLHKRRKKNPSIYLSEDVAEGYRVIYGIFDFEDAMHGAVLVDPKGRVTFEFVNQFGDNGKVLAVSEACVLPKDFFEELPQFKK